MAGCRALPLTVAIGPQQPTMEHPALTYIPLSAPEPDRILFLSPLVQGLPQILAHGLLLAFKAWLHFLWLSSFPLSTYLVGFQDQPRSRLDSMEIEIDTVPFFI